MWLWGSRAQKLVGKRRPMGMRKSEMGMLLMALTIRLLQSTRGSQATEQHDTLKLLRRTNVWITWANVTGQQDFCLSMTILEIHSVHAY